MKKQNINIKHSLINRFISALIVSIYMMLLIFGGVSLFEPNWLKDLSSTGKSTEALTMQEYGNWFLNHNEYEMASGQYKKALSINPDMAEAWANLGVALKHMARHPEALAAFEKALTYKDIPHDAVYYNMAEIFQIQGKPDKAVEYFYKSAETASFPMISYQKAGELLNNQGKWGAAFEAFQNALENSYTMQNCYTGMLKRDYHLFTDTLDKQNIKLLKENYNAATDLKSYDETAFEMALAHNPFLASIHNQIGYAYAMNKEYQKAIESFNTALKIKPDFQNARSNLNAAYSMLQKGGM
jgi:superkiller protein 3